MNQKTNANTAASKIKFRKTEGKANLNVIQLWLWWR